MIRRLYRLGRDFYIRKFRHGVRVSRKATVMGATLASFSHVGDYCFIYESVLGAYSTVGRNSVLRNAVLGKFCSISWNVTIGATPHNYNLMSTHAFHYISSFGFVDKDKRNNIQTSLGNDVWIGANAIVMPGVKVGDGAVVGAGAVVTKDVPPYAIVIGCPARIVRFRFEPDIVARLTEIEWWDWDVRKIQENLDMFKSPVGMLDPHQIKGS